VRKPIVQTTKPQHLLFSKLNKIASVGLRLTVSAAKCYISLPYNIAARTADIDKNVDVTPA